MCLIPTLTKYRLGCSFEDSTIYPSPAPPTPTPTPTPTIKPLTATHFTFYSQRKLKNSTVKKTTYFSPFPFFCSLFLPSFLHFFLFRSAFPFFSGFFLISFFSLYLFSTFLHCFFLSFFPSG